MHKQVTKDFWKNLLKLLKPFFKQMGILILLSAVYEIIKLVPSYLLKEIIDQIVIFDQEKLFALLQLIGWMLISNLGINIMDFIIDKKVFSLLGAIEYQLPMTLQKKLMRLSLEYHETEGTGNKIIKVQRGVDKLLELVWNFHWDFAPTTLQVIFTFFVMLYFNWQMSMIFIIFVPIFLWLTWKMNKKLSPMREDRHQGYEDSSGILGQSILNIFTVQSFSQEKQETRKFRDIRSKILKNCLKEWRYVVNYNFIRSSIINLGRISVLLAGVYFVYKGNFSVGSLVFFITLSEKAYFSLFHISRVYDRVMDCTTAVKRISDLMMSEPKVQNDPKISFPKKFQGEIEFQNVDFCYKGAKQNSISDISLRIKPGERVALIGPSGGGKSTIIKLLFRHYDITGGKVLIDGNDVRDYDIFKYRQQLGIVPQDVEIFDDTLFNNIAYAKKDATNVDVKHAAQIAKIDFIHELRDGYDTVLGERGLKLSGGQRQRVGIARAILNNPKILVFDEATSSLDSHSERQIQKAMENIASDTTMITIAHRLSTVVNADRIFVVENGKISQSGTHSELVIDKEGIYARLLDLQRVGELK